MRVLVTGATGKVGTHLMSRLPDAIGTCEIVALCNNRTLPPQERLTVIRGSLADAAVVRRALEGVTHVVHLAAVKESPDLAIDIAVKGMFLLLEGFRTSPSAERFVLIGGDCSVGHIFHRYDGPITEDSPRRAYPGCYALTKVIEEVMLEQYGHQYGLDGVCLRAPWIMEKDDFRLALSFGPDQFGGPPWADLLPANALAELVRERAVPVMLDAQGRTLRRGFIHVDDVVEAILAALTTPEASGVLNVAMDEPVDYGAVASHLRATQGYRPVEVPTPFHSNRLDNAMARTVLGWRPRVDLEEMIERAWAYERPVSEPRKVWYPG